MTIQDFWTNAFLTCLRRHEPAEAKKQADEALRLCIEHWQSKQEHWAVVPHRWQEQDIGWVPRPDVR